MKKLYVAVELDIQFYESDVITASVFSDNGDDYVYFGKTWLD